MFTQIPVWPIFTSTVPEANPAVINKLEELQPYLPLVAKMIDKLEKTLNDGEKTNNDQYVKLNSLLNVIQSKNTK